MNRLYACRIDSLAGIPRMRGDEPSVGRGFGDLRHVVLGQRLQGDPLLPRQHDGFDEPHHARQATTEASTSERERMGSQRSLPAAER